MDVSLDVFTGVRSL